MVYTEALRQIDVQVEYLLSVRAVFPYMPEEAVGWRRGSTAPLYRNLGFNAHFEFSKPLAAEDVARLNDIGHWINQCFVVRLYALLEYHNIVSNTLTIDQSLDGWEEVDILRRLRRKIAHTSGQYDPADGDERKLCECVIMHFSLNPANHPEAAGKYPIPIDKVLLPLADGCKRYVEALAHSRIDGQ